MKSCPNCNAANSNERLTCWICNALLHGVKRKRERQSPERIQLYHGGTVKKSTYEWMKRKDVVWNPITFAFTLFMLVACLISWLSP